MKNTQYIVVLHCAGETKAQKVVKKTGQGERSGVKGLNCGVKWSKMLLY